MEHSGIDRQNASIRFTLAVSPQSIQTGNRIGRGGGKAFIFSSPRKKAYQAAIAVLAHQYRPPRPLVGPLRVDFIFILPRPARLDRKDAFPGLIPHAVRPDRDNLIKGTQDGLTAACFWEDDAQIYGGEPSKFYAERGGDARIIVTIHYHPELQEARP